MEDYQGVAGFERANFKDRAELSLRRRNGSTRWENQQTLWAKGREEDIVRQRVKVSESGWENDGDDDDDDDDYDEWW